MNNQKKLVNFIKYYLPIVLWLVLIFTLSSIKGNAPHRDVSFWFYIERKGAHITEYFILTMLLLRLFLYKRIEKIKAIIFSIAISLLWAFSDEIHQLFVFGRKGKVSDVGIDFIGILIAILIAIKFYKTKTKK